jgi:hypothetical protein
VPRQEDLLVWRQCLYSWQWDCSKFVWREFLGAARVLTHPIHKKQTPL